MALYAQINVFKAGGYTSEPVASSLILPEYDREMKTTLTVPASPHGVSVPLGMTTAKFIYIETDKAISVVTNNSIERTAVDGLFFLIGTAATALGVIAPSGATLKIYLAGD